MWALMKKVLAKLESIEERLERIEREMTEWFVDTNDRVLDQLEELKRAKESAK